ncbi:DUF3073 domain-containing protein [Streptomonospora salina]|uniref:DUF3073 domain-containing protein n=1 Tax=Streptomonospora salina TaxID=104205 RepID=A0A841EI44_9ACTN|nr:DUF3073 domain-containing protein [Streptomonospora salina]MBB5999081.1 hypothetical protein [Streptomonospora salina]
MGRGRAKAKQQKVARRLKYNTGHTDLDQLRAELGVAEDDGATADSPDQPHEDPYDDLVDRYADLAEEYPSGGRTTEDESDRSDSLR